MRKNHYPDFGSTSKQFEIDFKILCATDSIVIREWVTSMARNSKEKQKHQN